MHAAHDGRRSVHYVTNESLSTDSDWITDSFNNDGIKGRIMLLDCTRMGFLVVEILPLAASDDMPLATYRIINPSTKRILDIPPPTKRILDPYKIIYTHLFENSSTNSYYVYSAYFDEEKNKISFELLDLGGQSNDPCPDSNLSWKTFSISEFDKLVREQRYKFSSVESKGILYILYLDMAALSTPKIICFDLVEQQPCTTLDVPDQSFHFNWREEVRSYDWRGKPAFSFVSEEKLNILVLEDYEKQKWADTIQIPLPFLEKYSCWNEAFLCSEDDGKVVLGYDEDKLSWWIYEPKSKQWSKIPPRPLRIPATLVSIKGMRLEKKESGLFHGYSISI